MLLTLAGDARKVRAQILKIEYELQVQVRRPVAILRRRSNRRNLLAGCHILSGLQALENFRTKMTKQGEKVFARPDIVPQHDQWPIIQLSSIIGEQFDAAIERREHRRPGAAKNVDAQMNGAVFSANSRAKKVIVVQVAGLGIAAKRKSGAGFGHLLVEQPTKAFDVQTRYGLSAQAAAATQVNDNRFAVGPDDRCSISGSNLANSHNFRINVVR